MTIPVLALPAFDPGARRIALTVAPGLTVAQIVMEAMPGLAEALQPRLRIVLVNAVGETVLAPEVDWTRVRPKDGTTVLIRVVPAGGDDLRNALLIAVSGRRSTGSWGCRARSGGRWPRPG
jgi:hypothetical protein